MAFRIILYHLLFIVVLNEISQAYLLCKVCNFLKLQPLYVKDDKIRKLSPQAQKYLQMKQLKKLRNAGQTYDDIKTFLINGTNVVTSSSSGVSQSSYQNLVGKGTFDQRLRAIVAYKRSRGLSAYVDTFEEYDGDNDDDDVDDDDDDDDDDLMDFIQGNHEGLNGSELISEEIENEDESEDAEGNLEKSTNNTVSDRNVTTLKLANISIVSVSGNQCYCAFLSS